MFLHLGTDYMLKSSEIIAIFNLTHPLSNIYEEYVLKHGEAYRIVDLTNGAPPASLILTEDTLYLSVISSFTLKKRVDSAWGEGALYSNL